jgi:hypothetical protein
VIAFLLLACQPTIDAERLLDTGWFEDTGSFDSETCPHYVAETSPVAGTADWYWRDAVTVWGNTRKADFYDAKLFDADGFLVADEEVWDDVANTFTLGADLVLAADTEHRLQVDDCRGRTEVTFTTSSFGAPLLHEASSLVDTTWNVDLVSAEWVEPGGFSALMALYFTVPLLVGVQWADDETIDLKGAAGYETTEGALLQDPYEASWEFPRADFTKAPFFKAQTEEVRFTYAGFAIPVTDFELSATISADASELGGGVIEGLGDTRYLGGIIDSSNPDPATVCNLAATVGATCQDCPDGEPYCLFLQAEQVTAERVDGLVIQ